MGRPKNDLETETFTVSTTPQVVAYLNDLVSTGLYGKNKAEAAGKLIVKSLEMEPFVLEEKLRQLKKRRRG